MRLPYRTNRYSMRLMRFPCQCQILRGVPRKYWFENRTAAYKIAPSETKLRKRMNEWGKEAAELAKDPAAYSGATYYWVMFLAMWGGAVRIMREIKFGGKSWKEIAFIVVCELLTSGFTGLMAFYSCQAAGVSEKYAPFIIGMAGYMGGRALSFMEEIYKGKTRRKGGQ